MKLSISNLAWPKTADVAIAKLLQQHNVKFIDVAPGKYFAAPDCATHTEISEIKNFWQSYGISIYGMQSLLFGTTNLNLFGTVIIQQTMLDYLARICAMANILGPTRLVFGAPKNRDRTGLTDNEAQDIAVSFFNKLGDIAQNHNVVICLEPNPARYGANFMTHTMDAAQIVQITRHPHIALQLDVGAILINNENPTELLPRFAPLIGHIHASEPDLVPLGDSGLNHAPVAQLCQQFLADHIVTIEMLETKTEPAISAIERAILFTQSQYGKAL